MLLIFLIFFLIRWCAARKKRRGRRGSGLEREMLEDSGDSRVSAPNTTVNMQNLSSITSFSDCGKQASSPLLNSSGFSPIYNGVPPEQRDLYPPSAGSSRQTATPHVAVGGGSDAGAFRVRALLRPITASVHGCVAMRSPCPQEAGVRLSRRVVLLDTRCDSASRARRGFGLWSFGARAGSGTEHVHMSHGACPATCRPR